MPDAILTDLAMRKFAAAVGGGPAVEVTQIGPGNGSRANYDPA